MKIPEEKIQEIKEAVDLIDIVSEYVTLRKRGSSYLGLCPFHTEKTPSFSVDPSRGFYHCFGCKAGGNVFTFVMQMEKISFPEAVRSLAEKTGIPLPAKEEERENESEYEALYYANKYALDFFQNCLKNTVAGNKALQYLRDRGFEEDLINSFSIGYAPNRWDGLVKLIAIRSVQPEMFSQAGLIIERKDGGFYDRFRGRLMFPIFNPSGRVVGFGGRTLSADKNTPKYINSPETLIYQKGQTLYGLHESKTGIRAADRIVLVEGYTDVMRMHQQGLVLAVATSGTALTLEQARRIRRYTRNVVLLFDGDSAGLNAAMRGIDILVAAGLHVKIAPLAGGMDPDEFLKEKGREAMDTLLGQARSFIDFRLQQLSADKKLDTPANRADAGKLLLEPISKIQDPIERNLMIKDLSEKLGIAERLLINEIHKHQKSDSAAQEPVITSARYSAEENLLKLVLENDRWGPAVLRLYPAELYRSNNIKPLMLAFAGQIEIDKPLDGIEMMSRVADSIDQAAYLSNLLSDPIDEDTDRSQLGLDCLIALLQDDIHHEIEKVRQKIRQAKENRSGDVEYQKKYIQLRQRLEKLRVDTISEWKKTVEIG